MNKKRTISFFRQLIKSIGITQVCIYVGIIVILFLLIGIQPFLISELFSFTKSTIDYTYLFLLLLSFFFCIICSVSEKLYVAKSQKSFEIYCF